MGSSSAWRMDLLELLQVSFFLLILQARFHPDQERQQQIF